MSRIKFDSVNFGDSLLICAEQEEEKLEPQISDPKNELAAKAQKEFELILTNARSDAQKIIDKAQLEAQKIIEEAKKTVNDANTESQNIKIAAYDEGQNEGYKAGFEEGINTITSQLQGKIQNVDFIVSSAFEMKKKILNSAQKDILELVLLIAKNVCLKTLEPQNVKNIVEKAVGLLGKKELINVTLSSKMADLVQEVLSAELYVDPEATSPKEEEKRININSVKIIPNPNISDDTIVVETPYERLDCSISSQIEAIAEAFLNSSENTNLEAEEETDGV